VPEQPHLYQSLTVDEAMRFHAGFYSSWDGKWADELAGGFQLDRARLLSSLSKGEMGKLEMLLALAQRPELLVLDEPTDGLDPVVRRDVLTALLEYVSQQNATLVISSHLVHELERICDWVGVMDRGTRIVDGRQHVPEAFALHARQSLEHHRHRRAIVPGLLDRAALGARRWPHGPARSRPARAGHRA
jgi:ABC-2 type transport system ATP-binding protein